MKKEGQLIREAILLMIADCKEALAQTSAYDIAQRDSLANQVLALAQAYKMIKR